MWLNVPISKDAIIHESSHSYVKLVKEKTECYWIGSEYVDPLFEDGFLSFVWCELDGILDYGDVEFYYPDRCKKLADWLSNRARTTTNQKLISVYEKILRIVRRAIAFDTGVKIVYI